jgi:hypothetical protein
MKSGFLLLWPRFVRRGLLLAAVVGLLSAI